MEYVNIQDMKRTFPSISLWNSTHIGVYRAYVQIRKNQSST